MSIVDKKYIDFYSKDPHAFRFPFKPIANELNIAHAISMTAKLPFGLNRKSICVYNPFSLSNVIRRNERHKIYLNEAEKVTAPTSELKEALFAFHKSLSRNNPLIMANLRQCQSMYDMEYPNADKSVYGLMMFEFVFDVSQHNAKYYVELLARKADLLNSTMLTIRLIRHMILNLMAKYIHVLEYGFSLKHLIKTKSGLIQQITHIM